MRKNRFYPMILFFVLCCLLLTACSNKEEEELFAQVDANFIQQYIVGPENCMLDFNDLVFSDPTFLPQSALFTYFIHDMQQKSLAAGRDLAADYYHADLKRYDFPKSFIEENLNAFFGDIVITSGYAYRDWGVNTPKDCLPFYVETPFGTDPFIIKIQVMTPEDLGHAQNTPFYPRQMVAQIAEKKVQNGQLVLDVDFYPDQEALAQKKIAYSKIYTMEKTKTGFRYQSVSKHYRRAEQPTVFFGLQYGFVAAIKDGHWYPMGAYNGHFNSQTTWSVADIVSPGEILTTPFAVYQANALAEEGAYYCLSDDQIGAYQASLQNIDTMRFWNGESAKGVLWLANGSQALPQTITIAEEEDNHFYTAYTRQYLQEHGLKNTRIHLSPIYTVDFDQDGQEERFFYANAMQGNEFAEEDVKNDKVQPGHGVYALLFMEKDGEISAVYEEISKTATGIDLYFQCRLLGLFDLDGDGIMELCFETMHWDCPSVFVYQWQAGRWQTKIETGFAW